MFNCSKKDSCINYKIRCFNCGAVADDLHPYPRYIDRDAQKLKMLDLMRDKSEYFSSAENMCMLVNYLVENGVVIREG